MSRKWKTLVLSGASLILAGATTAVLISSASTEPTQSAPQGSIAPRSRNLSLQPEAVRVNRRLGNRFKPARGAESILTGTLTVGTDQKPVTIIRRQTDAGEIVELNFSGRRLIWSNTDGIKAIPGLPTESERLLLERLVLDSADQFVLAQLRGASYYTVTRNLRPNDAGESYSGPLWTLVRVTEPHPVDDTSQNTSWRLYYVNEATDLIDRVVSERNGQAVEAGIQWTERNGDQVPSQIRWTMNGATIMELEVTAFSQNK